MQVPQRRALRTDEAFAPHVVAIGPYEGNLVALDVNLEPAHGLAQRTGPIMDVARRTHARTIATATWACHRSHISDYSQRYGGARNRAGPVVQSHRDATHRCAPGPVSRARAAVGRFASALGNRGRR